MGTYQDGKASLANFWWEADDGEVWRDLIPLVKRLRDEQNYKTNALEANIRLFSNRDIRGLYGRDYAMLRAPSERRSEPKLRINIVQSVIETLASEVSTNQPRCTVLTRDGDHALQTKAKKLSHFLDGIFRQAKLYETAELVFLDACVGDDGHVKIYNDGGRLTIERIFPDELTVDDVDARAGFPRSFFQESLVAREILLADYPDFEEQILKAETYHGPDGAHDNSGISQIRVEEAWHLPSDPDNPKRDGRYVMCINGADLEDYIWEHQHPPFVQYKWTHRLRGYNGKGVVEVLTPIQLEVNFTLQKIQQSLHLAAPHVFVRPNSLVSQAQLTNEPWSIIECNEVPTFSPMMAVPPDLFQHLQWCVQRAYSEIGVSELSAQARKPAGLSSGTALQEYNDLTSKRFLAAQKRWERFFVDCGYRIIEVAREIYKDHGDFAVTVKGKKFIETIQWSDVDMEDDAFQLQIFPTSFFPSTPSGKLEKLETLIKLGLVGKEQAGALLDFPDVEGVTSLTNAPYELIMAHIESILDKGHNVQPDPAMNLTLAMELFKLSYQKAKMNNAPEDRLAAMQAYMARCAQLQQIAQPPPSPVALPPPGGPMPPPGAPPAA